MNEAATPAPGVVARSRAEALDTPTRTFMESRIGYDFRRVRIHTGSAATDAARALRARAYTRGYDVVFAAGEYAPTTTTGRWLLAHELAHVVQQVGTRTHRNVANGMHLQITTSAPANAVQRQPVPGQPPVGPITQARADAVFALKITAAKLYHAIHRRDMTGMLSHDVDDALCRYFAGFGPDKLEDILARVEPMIDWIPNIPARKVPRPAPAGFRDSALLNLIAAPTPAQAMVRRDLPAMAPGPDYIAFFPEWYASPDLQATRLLHESIHFSWPGMHHARSWNDAFAWQGFISDLGGLQTGALLTGRYPPCP